MHLMCRVPIHFLSHILSPHLDYLQTKLIVLQAQFLKLLCSILPHDGDGLVTGEDLLLHPLPQAGVHAWASTELCLPCPLFTRCCDIHLHLFHSEILSP